MTVSAGNICGGSGDWHSGECNDSMVLSPATAKNVITVGGSESFRSGYSACTPQVFPQIAPQRQPGDFIANSLNNVAYISRRGTVDNRLKPEILAPATMVSSTRTASGQNFCVDATVDATHHYWIDSGTSFSSIQVAAAAVLIDRKNNALFTPAMLKAALVGNAHSMKGGFDRYANGDVAARPNPAQGFGRLYLGDALGSGVQTYLDESSWTPFTGAGQYTDRHFTVADPGKQVVIVLAWSDEPALVSANPTLVRDLDLFVPNSYCSGYTGNVMDSATETSVLQSGICANYTYDRANNVEMIALPAGRSDFTVEIISNTWGFGSHNQKLAFFAANAY